MTSLGQAVSAALIQFIWQGSVVALLLLVAEFVLQKGPRSLVTSPGALLWHFWRRFPWRRGSFCIGPQLPRERGDPDATGRCSSGRRVS